MTADSAQASAWAYFVTGAFVVLIFAFSATLGAYLSRRNYDRRKPQCPATHYTDKQTLVTCQHNEKPYHMTHEVYKSDNLDQPILTWRNGA